MTRSRNEWLGLIEVSGPFLAEPVLDEVFPQGLDALPQGSPLRLRSAHEEWRDAIDVDDPSLDALHAAWIDEVFATALDYTADVLKKGSEIPASFAASLPEHGITFSPDMVVVEPGSETALLAIHLFAPDVDLDATRSFDGWATTPKDRMVALLRAIGCPMGLVTNGERWILVHVPANGVTGFASWYARLWAQEPDTLRAFASLLGIRRFFGHPDTKLARLYERSLSHQDRVTDALGDQVRRAVEVLVQALDRADQDRNRELLREVEPRTLYEAGLTVMMRLVFLLAAEERGLLLLGDERYDRFYALSTLRMQLRAESEEILERRRSAWSRLLALFRAVYGGIEHPTLYLPALGGSLFDPDRYVFLEGRMKGTSWLTHAAEPLPIDDRTVLLLLESIQTFEGRTLSYRALDVEQIGHVYEGLLERTVVRVTDVTLELDAVSDAHNPRVGLGELESARLDGAANVEALIKERTGRSESAIRNGLGRPVADGLLARLLTVCRGDVALRDRIQPFASLLRADPWDYPLVRHPGSFVVVLGADRRDSGTHYTPKSLTEKIVHETLTPLAYEGPSEGRPENEWRLKAPKVLLDLKICDPAMGSGAFLVAVCRWLADRLLEAWAVYESEGGWINADGHTSKEPPADPLAPTLELRALIARRLIAENCIYGVDLNPLAVELAKLSLWLTTMSKGYPFGFLDHNLRSGDSLLGIHDLRQLIEIDIYPPGNTQLRLFGTTVQTTINNVLDLRSKIRSIPIRDINDITSMESLNSKSRLQLLLPNEISDAIISVCLSEHRERKRKLLFSKIASEADEFVHTEGQDSSYLRDKYRRGLATDSPEGRTRSTFHWPIEFPEVFLRDNPGFDAVVGNPPFAGGKKITTALGEAYREFLVEFVASSRRGNADLSTYFLLRYCMILRSNGLLGIIATKTIAQGETRRIGLSALVDGGYTIVSAIKSMSWPGSANLSISVIWIHKGLWTGVYNLDGKTSNPILPDLSEENTVSGEPHRLEGNIGRAFQGSNVRGMGFILTPAEADELIEADKSNQDVIFPFLGGDDILSNLQAQPSRCVINFFDWDENKAAEYELPFERVRRLVLPERKKIKDAKKRSALSAAFWKYDSQAKRMYQSIGVLERYLVHPLTSKHHIFVFCGPGTVLAHTTAVVASSEWDSFGILQSQIHWEWALKYGNKLDTRPQYTPSHCFDTFPFPNSNRDDIGRIGEEFYALRSNIAATRNIGLRSVLNLVDDDLATGEDIVALRVVMAELDRMVLRGYGWVDLHLEFGFHSRSSTGPKRYCMSDAAKVTVLERLLNLNFDLSS